MIPVKAVELVEVEYWTCCVPEHRHRSVTVAQNCVAKVEQKRPTRRWTVPELADAFAAVVGGETLGAVGKRYGITGSRLSQVISKPRRMAMHPDRLSEPVPSHDEFYSIASMRQHADFWVAQAVKLRNDYQ